MSHRKSRKTTFQFTLPHGERLLRGHFARRYPNVSIHAPAWGATRPPTGFSPRQGFQFTLPHGERHRRPFLSLRTQRFNSRSRMGSDTVGISSPRAVTGFNSRSRMGSDIPPIAEPTEPNSFNSRSRMGSDRFAPFATRHSACFNSRSRMGSDCSLIPLDAPIFPFQFTLPHGERPARPPPSTSRSSFQFTLPHGERLKRASTFLQPRQFQFTLPHGERLAAKTHRATRSRFNSRSRMGSD